jgi:hypothetical protein
VSENVAGSRPKARSRSAGALLRRLRWAASLRGRWRRLVNVELSPATPFSSSRRWRPPGAAGESMPGLATYWQLRRRWADTYCCRLVAQICRSSLSTTTSASGRWLNRAYRHQISSLRPRSQSVVESSPEYLLRAAGEVRVVSLASRAKRMAMVLEEIQRGISLSGIEPDQIVSALACVPVGEGAVQVSRHQAPSRESGASRTASCRRCCATSCAATTTTCSR